MDEKSKSWEGTAFRIRDDKFVVNVKATGAGKFAVLSGSPSEAMAYEVTVGPFGNQPAHCVHFAALGEELSIIKESGTASGRVLFKTYTISLSTLRYMKITQAGYLRPQSANYTMIPYMEVGKCSKISN